MSPFPCLFWASLFFYQSAILVRDKSKFNCFYLILASCNMWQEEIKNTYKLPEQGLGNILKKEWQQKNHVK